MNVRLTMVCVWWVGVTMCLCAAGETPDVKPFLREPFLLGAHRAGGSVLPESTVPGFKEAAKRWPGVLLETDVRLTADGHVVCMHDETVDRTTDGTGEVAAMTIEQLKALDAGYWLTMDEGKTFPYRGKGIQIATLGEVLEALPGSRFLVEFKAPAAVVDAAIKVIQDAGASDRVLLASFNPAFMARARELAPEMAMCYDYQNGMVMLNALRNGDWDAYTPEAEVLSLMRRMVRQFNVTREEIAAIRAKGVRFQIHTVDAPEEIRYYLAMGADSILSDRPDILAKEIAAWREKQGAPKASK